MVLGGLLGSSCLFAQNTINLTSESANPGSSVDLALSLSTSGTAPSSLEWTFSYSPSEISGVTVSAGPAATAAAKSVLCTLSSGSATCLLTGLNDNSLASGTLAYVTGTLASSATTTTVSFTGAMAVSSSAAAVSTSASGAVVTVPGVSSFACSPASLAAGGSSTCTATLSAAAPSGGSVLTLTSNNSQLSVPASVTVAAGATTGSFTATAANAITTNQSATVTATLGGSSGTASLSLTATTTVSSLSCSPNSLAASAASTCTVTLNQAAPAAGSSVTLASNNSSLSVPASVTVASGSTSAAFQATAASSISTNQTATITATLGSSSVQTAISLTAPQLVSPLFVQENAVKNGPANPSIVSLSEPSTSGDIIIIAITHDNQRGSVSSITDNKGNKYTRAISGINWGSTGSQARSELWYATDITGGGTPVSATVKFNATPASFVALYISEYSGAASLDQTSDHSATGEVSGAFSSGAKTTVSADELVFGHCETWSGTVSAGSGFTAHSTFDGNIDESMDVSSAGSYAATCNISGKGALAMMATFEVAPADSPKQGSQLISVSSRMAGSSNSPDTPEPVLRALSCSPRIVSAGSAVNCELDVASGSGSVEARLESTDDSVRVPVTVAVRPGQSRLTFQANTDPMAKQPSVTITATAGGSEVHESIGVVIAAAPAIAAPAKISGQTGSPISFTVRASAPANSPVEIVAEGIPAGAAMDSSRGHFDWIPAPSQAGRYQMKLKAISSAGQSAATDVLLEVGSGIPALDRTENFSCSPGALAVLHGASLDTTSSGSYGDTHVHVNGQLAPVVYSSSGELGFVCPSFSPGTPLIVTVETGAGESAPVRGAIQEVSPRILELRHPGSSEAPGERDFTMSSWPARPGGEIVVLATGLGPDRAAARLRFGDIESDAESIEADPDRPGVYAIHARIPQGLQAGAAPVTVKVVSSSGVEETSNSVRAVIE